VHENKWETREEEEKVLIEEIGLRGRKRRIRMGNADGNWGINNEYQCTIYKSI